MNSVVNAGMGGELFQNALKRTARAHGVAVDEMIEKNGSFRESLQEGWITSDILTETLNQLTMSYEEVGDEAYKTNFEILRNQGYSEEDAKAILELAHNAEQAATKVRTWTQLWDTVGEALGSGWATTWRTIVGDFLEATDLFTHLSRRNYRRNFQIGRCSKRSISRLGWRRRTNRSCRWNQIRF